MSFIEERLLDEMAYGFSGGPTWMTSVTQLRSGIERRNQVRSRPMHRFSASFDSREKSVLDELIGAFNACAGSAYGFRFKDWMDYEALDESFATGTGAEQTVQIVKNYVFGPRSIAVPIRKPLNGVVVKADGVPIAATVSTITGMAAFIAPLGSVVTWSGEFDRPVRFASDDFSGTIDTFGIHSIAVELVEDMSQ